MSSDQRSGRASDNLPVACILLRIMSITVLVISILGAAYPIYLISRAEIENIAIDTTSPAIIGVAGLLWVAALILVIGVALAGLLWAASLVVGYLHRISVHSLRTEHRLAEMGVDGEPLPSLAGGELAPLVTLLRDISENTLLTEPEKSRKRIRLQEVRRERLKAEIEQLIRAMKWPEARARIEDFRLMNPESDETRELSERLEQAIQEHQDLDVMTSCEQIRSYISLGLWSKAREASQILAEKYPGNVEARKMPGIVKLEEEVARKDERQRLYREIEHLVSRKHYRDAVHTAQSLLERYPESPEASALRGQMDELNRNADIEVRREMEARIIECTRQNKHREAYELARALLEQYPESPQAVALKDQIDKLRERAGM